MSPHSCALDEVIQCFLFVFCVSIGFLFSKAMDLVVFTTHYIQDTIVCLKGLRFIKTCVKVALSLYIYRVVLGGLFNITKLQCHICGKEVLHSASWCCHEGHTGHYENTQEHHVHYISLAFSLWWQPPAGGLVSDHHSACPKLLGSCFPFGPYTVKFCALKGAFMWYHLGGCHISIVHN